MRATVEPAFMRPPSWKTRARIPVSVASAQYYPGFTVLLMPCPCPFLSISSCGRKTVYVCVHQRDYVLPRPQGAPGVMNKSILKFRAAVQTWPACLLRTCQLPSLPSQPYQCENVALSSIVITCHTCEERQPVKSQCRNSSIPANKKF